MYTTTTDPLRSDLSLMFSVVVFASVLATHQLIQYLRKRSNFYLQELKSQYIQEFLTRGVVVIPSVLSMEEVRETRRQFHSYLAKHKCDVSNLEKTANHLSGLSTTGGAGGILDIFYADWKLKINEHPKVVSIINSLFRASYAECDGYFCHPYGHFDPDKSYMYIDRVCFRVPEFISQSFRQHKKTLQRSLTPHLDCCPHRLYHSEKQYPKWRPIQAFVALSDSLHINEGGFEAHPGFHLHFNEWVNNRKPSVSIKEPKNEPPCVGEFTPIRPIEDREVLLGMTHIPCRAGDMVCWDYRIPHANSRRNDGPHPREVIYIGVLPGVEMNRKYAINQLERYQEGKVPLDQWHEYSGLQTCDYQFSSLGRKLMAIENY